MGPDEEKVAVARLSVYSNSALIAMKLIVGVLMGSVGVISEAIHSTIDLLAAVIARYSVKKSAEPADREHRYGHGKFENLSGMIEGTLIFVAAAGIVYEASRRLFEEFEVEILGAGMAVMAVSAILNYYVSRRLSDVAKRTESLALEADAYHLKTDVWTSVGVFVALLAIQITGINIIDPIIALIVAAMIIHAAWDITRRSADGLLDKSLPDSEIQEIEGILRDHEPEFIDFHRLRARKMGSERQIDLHLTVPRDKSVKESHNLADSLEAEIKKRLPRSHVVVHIEPCDERCEKCKMTSEEKRAFTRREV